MCRVGKAWKRRHSGFGYVAGMTADPPGWKFGRREALALAGLLASGLHAPAFAAAGGSSRYSCANGGGFTIRLSEGAAVVRAGQSVHVLPRKPSSLGQRFASPDATLIVDGNFAALIGKDLPRFGRCYAAHGLAASR